MKSLMCSHFKADLFVGQDGKLKRLGCRLVKVHDKKDLMFAELRRVSAFGSVINVDYYMAFCFYHFCIRSTCFYEPNITPGWLKGIESGKLLEWAWGNSTGTNPDCVQVQQFPS